MDSLHAVLWMVIIFVPLFALRRLCLRSEERRVRESE